jgi:hypothetical protein
MDDVKVIKEEVRQLINSTGKYKEVSMVQHDHGNVVPLGHSAPSWQAAAVGAVCLVIISAVVLTQPWFCCC